LNGPTSYPNPLLAGWRCGGDGIQRTNLWYRTFRHFFIGTVGTFFNLRVYERRYEPARGGAVYICNHQSFLDPILMSLALRRPMNYMARDSLFKSWVFGNLIRRLNAFPVRRNSADTGALKEAMRRLKAGGQVVLFAEGTRSIDGKIAPLLPGVAMLAQRAAAWAVPVVIEGAVDCWPRTRLLPRRGTIAVQYGQPIPREQIAHLSPAEFVKMMHGKLVDIQNALRVRMNRPPIEYDPKQE